MIAILDNNWTINKQGLDWIQYFNNYTKSYTIDIYYFLILNRHKSHHLTDFELFCQENNIITLYMPAYLLYKL